MFITTDLKIARAIIKSILLISCETIGNATTTPNKAELFDAAWNWSFPKLNEIKNLIQDILLNTDIALDNDMKDQEPDIDFDAETDNKEESDEIKEQESNFGFRWCDCGL